MMRSNNVRLRIGTEATVKLVGDEGADALILAIEAIPAMPKLTCQDKSKVVWVGDIDSALTLS